MEDTLQLRLFERRGGSIEPTKPAVLLSRFVDSGFEELAEGVRRITKAKYHDQITINVSPYFATHLLFPRFSSFRNQIIGSELRLKTSVELPDFNSEDVDLAIQWGYDNFGDLETKLVVRDYKVICCTPELARNIGTPGDLATQTLLHPILPNSLWRDILRHFRVERKPRSEVSLHDAETMQRATLSGMGVGLVSPQDAVRDINAGDLVAPFGVDVLKSLAEGHVPGFFLIFPQAHRRIKSVNAFCNWVLQEQWNS